MPARLEPLETTSVVCCAGVGTGALAPEDATGVALRLRALAEPTRLRIISMLLAATGGELCTCELAPELGLTEATVSHHLTRLRRAGLVTSRREGMNVYHQVLIPALDALAEVLSSRPS